ncbi:MAG: LPS export ABC transporter periplasmic protein LptC [Nitrospinae bacterium]|nr:LPS export ABC transporter periplasmic protein LptC [Nitrospinota bacterium]
MSNNARFNHGFERLLRRLRALLLVGILLLSGGGAYHLLTRSAPPKTWMESNLDVSDGIKTKITGFRMIEKSANMDVWTVEATKASMTPEAIEMDDVRVDFLSGTKAETSFKLSSQKAAMDPKTQNATFIGEVRARTRRPITIETDALDWKAAQRVILTSSPVRIGMKSGVVTGKSLSMNLDNQTVALGGGVTASLNR